MVSSPYLITPSFFSATGRYNPNESPDAFFPSGAFTSGGSIPLTSLGVAAYRFDCQKYVEPSNVADVSIEYSYFFVRKCLDEGTFVDNFSSSLGN